MNRQNGSAIFIILIAVALFGALAYAFTQSSRGNTGIITSEATKAQATKARDCSNDVALATKRLTLRGCTTISSSTDMATVTDPACAIYHTNGGGVVPCQTTTAEACTVSGIGQACPDGSIYAGLSPDGNRRMYTTPSDAGWTEWNNGSSTWINTAMADCGGSGGSCNTGAANTTLLASLSDGASPYSAAVICDSLTAHGHSDWYLPAVAELEVLGANGDDIGNFDMTGSWTSAYYRSSSEFDSNGAWVVQFGTNFPHARDKNITFPIRCVRKD